MTVTSYETFRKNISKRIHAITGWNLSDTERISQDLINKVKESGGGSWLQLLDYGDYHTSPYRTLRDFLDVLQNSSFGISDSKLQKLLKKFKTVDCIEALSGFIKKYPSGIISLRKKLWHISHTKISNSAQSLQVKLHETYEKLKNLEKITLTELRTKLLTYANLGKLIQSVIGFTGVFVTDNEVIVGGLPLGGMGIGSPTSVQGIDVAHSNKIVKVRAVGSIFLAHQAGGKDSIIITGKLTGPLRMYWLAALWILILASQGKLKTIADSQTIFKESLRGGAGSLIRLNKLPLNKKDNIVTQKPAYEKHWTFPVVTSHEIITNCYIETFSFEEKIVNDRDVITYTLILRTYEEPNEFIADLEHSVYRQAKGITKSQQILKYSINFTYRMMKWAKESFDVETNIWKTENYYNVDALDMATVFGITMAGLAVGGV